MAAIVKANANLTAGGLSVLKRDFSTTDRGQVTYTANYVCLAAHARAWAARFRSGSEPPTPIPESLALLALTQTPKLVDLQSEIVNGLAYFNATYSAGVETDYIVTTSSEQRNIAWTVSYTGPQDNRRPIVASFDYISISVTVEAVNQTVNILPGSIGRVFNLRNVEFRQINNANSARDIGLIKMTVESSRSTRDKRGHTTNSVTSTGVFDAQDAEEPITYRRTARTAEPTPQSATFANSTASSNSSTLIRNGLSDLQIQYYQRRAYGLP
jgi:hypothetical protein